MVESDILDPRYSEEVPLGDGLRIRIRRLGPSDREKLLEGFRRLSSNSRYFRFFTPKHQLSDTELHFLTEPDGRNHLALVAVRLDSDGREMEGVGVARFVRIPEEDGAAEPAITVTDAMQGHGIGTVLCDRLSRAALESGVDQFRCHVLAENRRVQKMIFRLFEGVRISRKGSDLIAELDLHKKFGLGPNES